MVKKREAINNIDAQLAEYERKLREELMAQQYTQSTQQYEGVGAD
jgi:hypothetical protein